LIAKLGRDLLGGTGCICCILGLSFCFLEVESGVSSKTAFFSDSLCVVLSELPFRVEAIVLVLAVVAEAVDSTLMTFRDCTAFSRL